MSLSFEAIGKGPTLIFLHGWGMHHAVFQPLVEVLADQYRCVLVDLPGHGTSAAFTDMADIDLLTDYVAERLADILSQPVYLLGWSLGALLAQNMAVRLAPKIRKLILFTATPSFVERADWPAAVPATLLEQFNIQLHNNFSRTLDRFLALQFMHAEEQKTHLRLARELAGLQPSPQPDSLDAGLTLLLQTDLRSRLVGITCPTLIINGEHDSLVPTPAALSLAQAIPRAQALIVRGAGHAPFLSHLPLCVQNIERFLHEAGS